MSILDRFRLDGRTAIVTGGAQGIGRSFSFALAEAGAKVAVADMQPDAAGQVARELLEKGHDAMPITVDVRDEGQVAEMVKSVLDKWGGLTIAVNNAGIALWKDAMEMELSEWREIIDVNLDGVFLCCRESAKAMARSGYGKIINTASMSAHISNTPQNQSAYNVSKAGVVHLTHSLAAEWAQKGIRVNSISPGYTKTALVEQFVGTPEGKSVLDTWMQLVPMGRMATPEDLQGAVCFLAAEVSDYMTGADLLIDGGYCCW